MFARMGGGRISDKKWDKERQEIDDSYRQRGGIQVLKVEDCLLGRDERNNPAVGRMTSKL